jgi:hypothetical protein
VARRSGHPIHGKATIRDQKLMSDSGIRRALQDHLELSDWSRLLNQRVSFWATLRCLDALLAARAYREGRHSDALNGSDGACQAPFASVEQCDWRPRLTLRHRLRIVTSRQTATGGRPGCAQTPPQIRFDGGAVPEPRLDNGVLKVRQIIDEYRAGRIVIPEFQREYVWRKGKASKLVDSLYRGYPISSLLLWISTEQTRSRHKNPRPSSAATQWLIDGQQRVITLSRCASGDEGIDVVFQPDTGTFRLSNAATRRDPSWYRLAEIWDDEHYRRIRRNLIGAQAEAREAAFERVRRVLEYEIPVLKMIDHPFEDAVQAFRRINTLGMKLKAADIESAEIAARHSGFIADLVAPFLADLHRQGYTRLTVMHLFRVCAFIAHPDGRSRTPLHELETREVLNAWKQTQKAVEDALSLVRGELGLLNMDLLWSGALLVPVMALCALQGPRDRDAKATAAWLSIAALLHRYSGSAETKLDLDLKACRAVDPIGALLTNLRRDEGKGAIVAYADDFAGALADRGGLLAAFIACRQRGIRDLFTNGEVLLQPHIHRHHILPRGQFPDRSRASADCVANIAFITDTTNRSINMSGPEVYLDDVSEDVLRSQCVPSDRNLWRIKQAQGFWAARRELLAEAFNEFLEATLPNRRLA